MTKERSDEVGDRDPGQEPGGSRAASEAGETTEGSTDPGQVKGDTVEGQASRDEGRGGERAPELDDSTAQLETLQEELETLNDRHLRLAAEFDNYRKRVDRERAELRARSQAELVGQLLEVLDDLQRVAHYDPDQISAAALRDGASLVEKKLRRALERAGLEPIDAEGEFFNPATMEAIMTMPAEHPEEDDVVADVFQKGYRFKDVLIRPARVRVKKYDT